MRTNKLLVAIPTYNRASDIDVFLQQEFFLGEMSEVDVCIYDSSEGKETEEVVNAYKNKEFSNLSYEHLDSTENSNSKLFLVYEQNCTRYKFIWFLHDHTVFTKDAMQYILESIKENRDFYFLDMQRGTDFCAYTYGDLQDFGTDAAWFLGKMGASILNSETFLAQVDWQYYLKKYLWSEKASFAHIGFYLERATQIAEFSATKLSFPRGSFCDTYKHKRLTWDDAVLQVCTQCWGEVVMALPDVYCNKSDILQTMDQYFITKYKLIEHKAKGIYAYEDFLKYEKWIKEIFPGVYDVAREVALLPEEQVKEKYVRPLVNKIEQMRKEGYGIYIYGAGRHGVECVDFLEICDVILDGFVVTDMEGNPERIRQYPVNALSSVLEKDEKVFVILAVMELMQKEIIKDLKVKLEQGHDIMWMAF